jgi:hypothetical protein
MAKPLPRLPVAGVEDTFPIISLSDDGWSKIEAACGWSVDSELRDAIRTHANAYLRGAQFELDAKPLAPALGRLQRIRKAAARFQAELKRAPEPESARYANFLIKQNFADSWSRYGRVRDLADVLQERGFPTGVRKDVDKNKSNASSSFVVLIQELQKLIPKRFRRGSHSDVALATLMSKAIRGR